MGSPGLIPPFMPSFRSLAFRGVRLSDRLASFLPACGGFRPLRGSFSAFNRLRDGILGGSILHPCQAIGSKPPGSITEKSRLTQDDCQPWPVFWTVEENARLTGGIRLWRDAADRYCAEGNFHFDGRRRLGEDRFLAHMLPGPQRRLEGAWTSIASNWGDGRNYFHWITDGLTRLLVRGSLPETTRILLPVGGASYIRETLELLGLSEVSECPRDNHLIVDRFYFCSPVAMTGVWNPLGFDWLRESFRKYFRPPASGPPVFLTRRASTRIPGDLPGIERIFANAGFEIVDCGTLGVRQQIELASGAKAVAGVHGAAMTNLLWSPPGTPVLELFLPGYLNACYEQIAFQGSLHYTPLILMPGDSPKLINEWVQHLEPGKDATGRFDPEA